MADRVIDVPNENNVPILPVELNHVLVVGLFVLASNRVVVGCPSKGL